MFAVIILLIILATIAAVIVHEAETKERNLRPTPYNCTEHPDGDPLSVPYNREAQEAIDEELAQEDHWQRKTKHESIMPPDY